MSLPCDICDKIGHPWFDCPKRSSKPPDWKPERLTRAKPNLSADRVRHVSDASPAPAGSLDLARRTDGPIEQHVLAPASPAATPQRPIGRPKTITDMKAYKREKAVKYRANKKAKEAEVTEYEKALAKAKHGGTEAEFRAANMAAYGSIKAKEAAK